MAVASVPKKAWSAGAGADVKGQHHAGMMAALFFSHTSMEVAAPMEQHSVSADSSTTSAQASVEIFDPPLCCSTGLCGPTLDQTLLDVNEALLALRARGVRVDRFQMTTSPQAFLGNADVMRLVREQQMAALPITVVNGRLLKSGAYPTQAELRSAIDGD
jgi:hypothetical protein